MKGLKLVLLAKVIVLLGPLVVALGQEKQIHSIDTSLVTVIHENASGSSSDFFGFTVSIAPWEASTGSGWVFIGAPKSNVTILRPNNSTYLEPGVIWRCKVGSNPVDQKCEMLHFLHQICRDRQEKKEGSNGNTFFGTCDSSFMGGSLAFDNGILVACAPLWRREKQKFPLSIGRLRLDGACYWMNEDAALGDKLADELAGDSQSSNRGNLIPFQDNHFNIPAQASWKLITSNITRWYYAGAGTSVHVTRKKEVLLGAPLTHLFWGSMLKVEGDSYTKWGLTNLETYSSRDNPFDHFGYAVTSGNYVSKNQSLYAASSPRANQQHDKRLFGVVLVLESATFLPSEKFTDKDKIDKAYTPWKQKHLITGPSLASYFGASMESVDINGDGLDELIVGAPLAFDSGGLHSSNRINTEDQGCVYIYSTKNTKGFTHPTPLCGKAPGGRFGTSIAKLGDLNQDGYNDFAVGAPYEEGGGTVYIYYGSDEMYMRGFFIKGQEYVPFSPDSSFGCSIAGGVDLDGNGTPDLSVGNYGGKSVAIFRTRRMLRINSSMLSYTNDRSENPVILSRNATRFTLELCVTIEIMSNTNKNLPHDHDDGFVIHSTTKIDGRLRRFRNGNRSIVYEPIVIPKGETSHCLILSPMRDVSNETEHKGQEDVLVEHSLRYNETAGKPIQISMLNINNPMGTSGGLAKSGPAFADFCPNCPYPMSTETVQLSIPFEKDCKRRKDNSTLHVCKPDLRMLLIGRYGQSINLNSLLKGNIINLTFGDTPWLEITVQVKNLNETAYSPRVLLDWRWKNGNLPAPTLQSKGDMCNVTGQVADCKLDPVRTYLDTNLTQSQVFRFNMQQRDPVDSQSKQLVVDVQVYLESDSEYSPVNASRSINYHVNASLNQVQGILSNYTFPITSSTQLSYNFKTEISGNSPVRVTMKFLLPESVNWGGKKIKMFQIGTPKASYGCTEGQITDRAFATYQKSPSTGKGRFEALYDRSNCKAFDCTFHASRDNRFLEIIFPVKILDTKLAEEILSSKGAMEFYGMAYIRILDLKAEVNVTRIIINPPEQAGIESWILLVAAVSGLLFLVLLIFALYKFGFFKRDTREKLELLKAEMDAEDDEIELEGPIEDNEEKLHEVDLEI